MTDQELLAALAELGIDRIAYGGQLASELNARDHSLNAIATKSGVPATTIKRWVNLTGTRREAQQG